MIVESVDPQRMKTMAALLDDPNPIHYDVDVVRSLGYGDAPINQGPIHMAFLQNVAINADRPRRDASGLPAASWATCSPASASSAPAR